jgi:hypothetical protein
MMFYNKYSYLVIAIWYSYIVLWLYGNKNDNVSLELFHIDLVAKVEASISS